MRNLAKQKTLIYLFIVRMFEPSLLQTPSPVNVGVFVKVKKITWQHNITPE